MKLITFLEYRPWLKIAREMSKQKCALEQGDTEMCHDVVIATQKYYAANLEKQEMNRIVKNFFERKSAR